MNTLRIPSLLVLAALAAACASSTTDPAEDVAPDAASPPPDSHAPDVAAMDIPPQDAAPDASPDTGVDTGIADTAPPADAAVDAVEDVPADVVAPTSCTPQAAGGEPTTATLNGWVVNVETTGAWSIVRPSGGAAVLEGPGTCVEAALPGARIATGKPFVNELFGAYQIGLEGEGSELGWEPVSGAPPTVETDNTSLTVTWQTTGGSTLTLRFEPYGVRDLRVALDSGDPADAGELSFTCGADESFFGLGTQAVGMDLRGRTYPIWTQEQGIDKPEGGGVFPLANVPEAAYAPMGVWYSSRGATAILDTEAYAELDLCKTHADRAALRTYAALPALVLVAGATPKERLTALTDYTGRVSDPPPWVFAPWNDAVGGPERLHEVAEILRSHDIPSSAIWSEDWIGGEQTGTGYRLSYAWAWDPATYPDLPGDVQALHAQGFAFLAYFNPFVPEPTLMWTEGNEGGFLVKNAAGETYTFLDPAFRDAGLVDLTNDGAVAWLKGYLTTAAKDLAIDGWMADFAEWMPTDAVLADGRTGWEYHNHYPLDWQRVNREVFEAVHATGPEAPNNWTFFARSGFASTAGGSAGLTPTLWGGDQNTDWDYDDGLPTVLPIAANVGLAGVAIFGSDIAGYTSVTSDNTDKELFLRWSAMGALHPLMRTHHGSDECGNWSFDRDEETLAHYRRYAVLHTLLYPHFRALADEALATGLPLTRHPYLVEPLRPSLWEGPGYEVFLGDDVLVAPVLEQGATSRVVRFPSEGWWPLLGGAPIATVALSDGSVEATVDAPVTELPAFVRPGTILPLLADPVDSFYGATEEGVTDLSDVAGRFRAALYPDESGSVGPAKVGDAEVSGTGLTGDVDWATATVDGAPLPPCSEATSDASCADGDTVVLRGSAISVVIGDASLAISSPTQVEIRAGIAGAAFGEWAAPTLVTDLHPDIPPPCEQ